MSGPRQRSFGASVRNMSVSLRPTGSRPSSSAPARAMIRRISGTAVISSRWMRRSVWAVSSTEMVGCLRIVTIGVPSSMVGIKVAPMRG